MTSLEEDMFSDGNMGRLPVLAGGNALLAGRKTQISRWENLMSAAVVHKVGTAGTGGTGRAGNIFEGSCLPV